MSQKDYGTPERSWYPGYPRYGNAERMGEQGNQDFSHSEVRSEGRFMGGANREPGMWSPSADARGMNRPFPGKGPKGYVRSDERIHEEVAELLSQGHLDASGIAPGSNLLERLFKKYAPCLILIDEWVAYLRQIYKVEGLPSGSFDANLSFVQSLTEAVKRSTDSMLLVSVPQSDIEIGGEGGQAAALVQELVHQVPALAAHPADLAQGATAENGMQPDSVLLSGSFDTIERFAIQEKVDGVGNTTITLQNDGAMARLRAQIPAGKLLLDVLGPIFKAGRILRFIDNGKGQLDVYGYISGVAIDMVDGVEVVKVEEKDGKASVRFWQSYESKSFKSRVLKSLELVKADGDWKIHRERLIPVEAKASNA